MSGAANVPLKGLPRVKIVIFSEKKILLLTPHCLKQIYHDVELTKNISWRHSILSICSLADKVEMLGVFIIDGTHCSRPYQYQTVGVE